MDRSAEFVAAVVSGAVVGTLVALALSPQDGGTSSRHAM